MRFHSGHDSQRIPTLRACATRCAPRGDPGMVFAKNSDRPPGEVQVAWPFGRRSSAGCTLRTQYLTIGDAGAHAAFLSCPTWLWGAEHGVNEHGVAIGNERVSTTHDAAAADAGPDRDGPGPPRPRARPQRGRGGRGHDRVCWRRAGRAASPTPPTPRRTTPRSSSPTPPTPSCSRRRASSTQPPPSRPAPPSRNRITLGTDWTCASAALAPGDDFGRFRDTDEDTRYADVRLAASRRFLATAAPGGLTPAATAAHLRDHGTGPWGAPGVEGPVEPPPAYVGSDFTGVSVCMHVRGLSVTTASMIAELPLGIADGAPLRAYVATGSPCASIYVPAFPRTVAGPPPFIPLELSGEELWHAADVLRQRVEAQPGELPALRAELQPVEDELWADADDVLEDPSRLGQCRRHLGQPGPARAAAPAPPDERDPPIRVAPGGTLRRSTCAPTRQGGPHDHGFDRRRHRRRRRRQRAAREDVGVVPGLGDRLGHLRLLRHQLPARQRVRGRLPRQRVLHRRWHLRDRRLRPDGPPALAAPGLRALLDRCRDRRASCGPTSRSSSSP